MNKYIFLMVLAFPLCKGEESSSFYKEKLEQELKELNDKLSETCKLPAKLMTLCKSEKSPCCSHYDNNQKNESYYCWRCKKSRNYDCHQLKQFFAYSSEQNGTGEAYWYLKNMTSKDIHNTIGYSIRKLEESVDLEPQDSIELIKETIEALARCASLSKQIEEKKESIENYTTPDQERTVIIKTILKWLKS